MGRLEREVIESFKAITKRGSEIGGVLLGRASGSSSTVIVDAYEGVPCEYSRGPLYLLADDDKTRLAAALQRLKASAEKDLSVVGFFRSNTRKDLALDEDDLALMSEFFRQPTQVCLLVKPFSMKPSLASFFIWEGGRIEGEVALLQFPFRCGELLKAEHAKAIVRGDQLPSLTAQPRVDGGPAVAAPKPEPRTTAPLVIPRYGEPPAPPRPEPRVMTPPVVPKREEPAPPPPAPPRPEPRVMTPPPVAKREEPAPPPRPEARTPLPSVIPRRETPPPAPPVAPKPEARAPVSPPVEKREASAQPAAPKAEARASVTPSLVRREAPVSSKPDVRPVEATGAAKREESAPLPKPDVRAAVPAVVPKREEAMPSPAPARLQPVTPASPADKKEEPAPPSVARREATFLTEALPEESPSRTRLYLIAAALAVALIGTGGYLYMRSGGDGPAASSAANDAGLALRVERNAGQLLLSWNREATAIRTAQKAVLSIYDGDHKEDIELDLGQLRSGSIVYSPITNDVSFRLDVLDAKGKRMNESVRVIAGRPSPAAPLGQTSPARQEDGQADSRTRPEPAATTATAAVSRSPAEVTAGPSPTPGGGAEPPSPAPAKPAPQTTPTGAESLAARLSSPANLPEPPGLDIGAAATPRPVETLNSQLPPAAQVPKPTPQQGAPSQPATTPTTPALAPLANAASQPSATPAQPAAAPPQEQAPGGPLRVGGSVQQAKVVREVTPAYPPLARQARVSGVVRVEATVGRDGRIVRVQALSGPPLLRQAAVDAVRQWVYRPTLLNGQPVEVVTQVDVTFNLNR